MKNIPRRVGGHGLLLGFLLLAPALLPREARGQYFGQNKVQYQNFDFMILKTEHIDIYYYPPMETAAEEAARMAERWNTRFAKLFNHTLSNRQPLILYANHADFQQTNVVGGIISQGTGGVTEGAKRRIVLPLTGVNQENNHVIGHELVHGFQFDLFRASNREPNVPLWFIEGMAEYLTIGRTDPLTAMWLRDAVLFDDVPSINDISRNPKYFPYRYGHALWSFLTSRWGDNVLPLILKDAFSADQKLALEAATGMKMDSLSGQWEQSVRALYGPQLEGKTKPAEVGRRLISGGHGFNLSPSLSPDGRWLAFLSRHDLFTIDLFLADARTGEIKKKLVSSNSDAHFDALRFMDSAGAWSPDSRRLAFVVVKDGDNAVSFMDVESQDIKRTVRLPGVDGITYLDWSPDGRRLVVAGTAGGTGDLWLFEPEQGNLRRLTDDRYSEIQPAWSPDGRTLAVVTERGADTNLETLDFGAMKIGLMDPATGQVERLISMQGATKHISPCWSVDGRYLYFVADPDGVSNIFRFALESGQYEQLTNIATGVSGLTELSPALTIARSTGQLAFPVFEKAGYYIQAMPAQGGVPEQNRPIATEALLPPGNRPDQGEVYTYLRQYQQGLPEQETFPKTNYKPDLGLVAVAAAGAGVGFSSYGLAVGGGIDLLFTDMLGNHDLYAGIQANGGVKDVGGSLAYVDRSRRLNWGFGGAHIPYLIAQPFYGYDSVAVNGQGLLAYRDGVIRQRVFVEQIPLLMQYPLSANRRLEFTTGFTRYSYDSEVYSDYYALADGAYLGDNTQSLPSPPAINLWESNIAYVGDYSFFGFIDPVNGSRYRFELTPTFGSLQFFGATADYRRYLFANPLTLAFRLLHYGRYGRDSEDYRLSPLFLGHENLIRGYSAGSLTTEGCLQDNPNDLANCPQIDRLIGSRIGVFNAELRIPLLGNEQFGLINFPYLPLELLSFFDGGVAWNSDDSPKLKWAKASSEERIPVFSAGVGARIAISQYFALQFYYARPFQRTDKNTEFGFTIAPGW